MIVWDIVRNGKILGTIIRSKKTDVTKTYHELIEKGYQKDIHLCDLRWNNRWARKRMKKRGELNELEGHE